MAQVTRLVCDMCSAVDAETVKIVHGRTAFDIDLCASCRRKHIEPLAKRGRKTKVPGKVHKFHVTELPPQPS